MKVSRLIGLAIAVMMLLSLGLAPTLAQDCDGEVIELEFMNWWGAAREALMDTLIGHFQEENPCIRIINQVQPWDNRAELLATAAASSNPPGIIMSTRPETYHFAISGLIIPIDSFVEAHGTDLSVFYDGEIGLQYWNGELYGLPMPTAGGLTSLYIYNKDMLRDAGFDPEAPPKTWQELEEMSAAITVADPMGVDVMGTQVIGITGGDAAFVSWLYTNNGRYASDDGRTLLFNSPEGIETLEWMVNFTNNINGGVENVADFFQDTAFAQGDHPWYEDKLAFLRINTSFYGHYNVNDPEGYADTSHWGTMLRPYNGDNPNATHAGTTGYNYSGAWAYTIPAVHPPEKQEAAFKFAEFIGVHPLGGCAFLFAQSRPSPVKACNENPAYYEVNPTWSVVLEGLATDVAVSITPVQGQLAEILANAVEEALFGVKSPADALNDAHEEMQALLDEFWAEFDADNM
ncbi:MAG: extracellular solute-binding protein [Chloroflexi bacterium]|nr:extracellular solute-binding protein [Chloroflexota bacterium]